MSVITDYFTDLADKVREKSGSTSSYTPDEIIDVGINQVYTKGVSDGGTGARIGTASEPDVISGATFTNTEGVKTGTMPNKGAVSTTINCGQQYTIAKGYHNGNGIVTAAPLSPQTAATASASQILKNYTAWVAGSKLTGSMPNYSSAPLTVSTTTSTTTGNQLLKIPTAGYHTSIYVNPSASYNLGVTNTKKGTAGQNQVLAGYSFTSTAVSPGTAGAMKNYASTASVRKVTPTAGSTTQMLSLGAAGYHTSVIVDRSKPYAAGVSAQKATTWSESWQFDALSNDYIIFIPVNSITQFKVTWTGGNQGPLYYWYDAAGNPYTPGSEILVKNTWYKPTDCPFVPAKLAIMPWSRQSGTITVTRKAEKIR